MDFRVPKGFVITLLVIDLLLASVIIYVNYQSEIIVADENICEEGTKYELLPSYRYIPWSSFPIMYAFDSSFPNDFQTSFDQAVAEWNQETNRELFRKITSVTSSQLVILEQSDEFFLENTLGYARGASLDASVYPTKSVINFNPGKNFEDMAFSCELFPLEYNGPYDFQSVAVHELGHILGLGHVNDEFATMHTYYKGSFGRTLSQGDLDGFHVLYP